jgi:hypothetical protein
MYFVDESYKLVALNVLPGIFILVAVIGIFFFMKDDGDE